ncbi:Cysteine desulfurase, SufS subfamily [Thioalkalivibrio nitratireducens DSM 14787]|uniref:Cysteine desulfurase n=1 Tax=Thioalkalivibrio nitratireducens (strain DSM 14787 / UNIQEM 213 / ALEN2) TaxID=1255043 RepID=L0E243_THIND|nr:cysteine desulfurase [Thioalkalivibrio nitratireducens]AGA34721.1 Cysteine desulfurase, SufS subfamily [Thioalkalivibrio nitratireducens DSM 14787]
MNAAMPPPMPEAWDVAAVRRDFPILEQQVHGHPLAYLDNAATTQKPQAVLDALDRYYRHDNANVHRGVHALAERATVAFEAARESARRFLNARTTREIVFVRGTTEAINLVASSFGGGFAEGDEVILSAMEHHANIVPWQLLRERTGIVLRVLPITAAGELDLDALPGLFSRRTRLLSMVHVSNALGTINPVRELVAAARERGVPVLLDGAQAVPHLRVDVQALDCDFYAFSGHKAFGPTGIGVLYGRERLLEAMPPYQGGGEMIRTVSFEKTTYAGLPHRYEAGTPDIAGAIGLGQAIEYLEALDWDAATAYEQWLLAYATECLMQVPGLRIIGQARDKVAVISFVMDGVHPHDMGTILDRCGLAVRAGHHCAMPVMTWYGVPATSRASMAFYNTPEEIDRLAAALHYAREMLA